MRRAPARHTDGRLAGVLPVIAQASILLPVDGLACWREGARGHTRFQRRLGLFRERLDAVTLAAVHVEFLLIVRETDILGVQVGLW